MKISNETKIGALTSIAIVLLILGFNFLKGKSFTSKNTHYYAVFDNIEGLSVGNPVVINGKQVGSVISTDGGRDMRKIVVTINMNLDVDVPDNSVGVITPSLLGTTAFEIKLGNSPTFYKPDAYLQTEASANMFGDALQKIDPVLAQVTIATKDLDTLLNTANAAINVATLRGTMENINKMTAQFVTISVSLNRMLNAQNGAISQTMDHLDKFTAGLASNNDKISHITANLETTTDNLSKIDFNSLQATIDQLRNDITTDKGTLGKLLNDNTLYGNLTATSNKLNLLLDDIRTHPKRYINISVFGKKDKSQPLMIPLADTVNAPYIKR